MSIGAISRRRPEALSEISVGVRARAPEPAAELPLTDGVTRSREPLSFSASRGRDEGRYASCDTSRAERLHAGRSKESARAKDGEVEEGAAAATAMAPPPDLDRLTALRERADDFEPDPRVLSEERAEEIRAALRTAEECSARGDYHGALEAYESLGMPLPEDLGDLSREGYETCYMLGIGETTVEEDGSWSMDGISAGAHGDQRLNDLDGFAANARMMVAMEDAGLAPSGNPPTEEEARAYMAHVAESGDEREVLEASRTMIDGMVVHYSAADESNPRYARDDRRYVLVDESGERTSYATRREALDAARERDLPRSAVHTVRTREPSTWEEAMALDTRAGRHVGDCESKLYFQHQLLDAAGFDSLGSVSVSHGSSGHALGIVRSEEGNIYVTSNEDAFEVHGTGEDGEVTEADLHRTCEDAIRQVYGLEDSDSLESFDFAYGAEPAESAEDPGVESTRRAAENLVLEIDEPVLR